MMGAYSAREAWRPRRDGRRLDGPRDQAGLERAAGEWAPAAREMRLC